MSQQVTLTRQVQELQKQVIALQQQQLQGPAPTGRDVAKHAFRRLHSLVNGRECDTMLHQLETAKESVVREWGTNPFVAAWVRTHGAEQDTTVVIDELSSRVLEARRPAHIGNDLVTRLDTTRDNVKIRLPKAGKAVKDARGGHSILSKGERQEFASITPDRYFDDKETWDQTAIEDADWNVAATQAANVGLNMSEIESQIKIDELTECTNNSIIPVGDTAGTESGPVTLDKLISRWGAVLAQNGAAQTMATEPLQLAALLKDSDFKDQTRLGMFADYSRGMVGNFLGMQMYVSTQIPTGKTYVFDRDRVVFYVVRRDRIITPYVEDGDQFAIKATSRYGIGKADTKVFSWIG